MKQISKVVLQNETNNTYYIVISATMNLQERSLTKERLGNYEKKRKNMARKG